MEVKQLIGRFTGQIIDMPYAEATACIAAGTACLPDEQPTNIRGLQGTGESQGSGQEPRRAAAGPGAVAPILPRQCAGLDGLYTSISPRSPGRPRTRRDSDEALSGA